VGLVCGFFIGRWFTLIYEPKRMRRDREQMLAAVASLMSSTDKLNEDVDVHNAALFEAERDISEIRGVAEVEHVQDRLLTDITYMVEANRKLEDELVESRQMLAIQAQELDKRKREARTDALCNVGNRKAFDEALHFMLNKLRGKKRYFSLMLIDVDNFKRINDTFGHSAGDQVLTAIGEALKSAVRPCDTVCRLGGDEFAILFDRTGEKQVRNVALRLRAQVEEMDFITGDENQRTLVTMSMGVTTAVPADTDASLYNRADEALYKSKAHGRNCLSLKLSNGDPLNHSRQRADDQLPKSFART
jgi:diguanylate cyclase